MIPDDYGATCRLIKTGRRLLAHSIITSMRANSCIENHCRSICNNSIPPAERNGFAWAVFRRREWRHGVKKYCGTIERMSETIENLRPAIVYKILPAAHWTKARKIGAFDGSDDDLRDGYIHLSGPTQVIGTLQKYFLGQQDLLLVAFRASDLGLNLKWEPSRSGQAFPHLYEPLKTRLALWQKALALGPNGIPIVEEAWLAC